MKKTNFSRRDFIKGIGVAGGVGLLGAGAGTEADAQIVSFPTWLLRKRCKQAGAIIRKSFKYLTASELTAYKNGVAAMKALPITNPTSWAYQAAIHGHAPPLSPAWNTCQHSGFSSANRFFLSWHRMYLCFFERILRKKSGNPNFGLPYWNYSETADPNARYLPAAFRSPANATNPLWTPSRTASINNPTTPAQLAASAVDLSGCIPGPVSFNSFSSNLESTPHGAIHNGIGGGMMSFNTAGLDAIFWLHHCNIDRLWNRWLGGGGGRSNPPASDTAWYNTPYTFFDENGTQVQMTGADIVSAANSMCRSCYDEETVYIIRDIDRTVRFKFRELILARQTKTLLLDTKNLRFELALEDRAKDVFSRAAKAQREEDETRFRLNFEGVKADKPVPFYYEVYLNLPEGGTDPDYTMDEYAGNLTLFGAGEEHAGHGNQEPPNFGVDITDGVRRVKNLSAARTVSVTLVPTALVDKNERRLPIRSDVKISVERVTLAAEEPEK